jgi:DNA (cytosine-5)-methyltransferase 1
MILLDTYCKAGGCSVGYNRAGFEVVGVYIEPQPHYPFEFHQADALEFIARYGREFDVIHASPPCQVYSVTAPLSNGDHPDLVEPTRKALLATGRPYIIENVPGAPLINPIILCGTMFGLKVIRHRLFETRPVIWWSPFACNHNGKSTGSRSLRRKTGLTRTISLNDGCAFVTVAGNNYLADEGREAMGIDWMTKAELSQAIPPVYTEWLGRKIIEAIKCKP